MAPLGHPYFTCAGTVRHLALRVSHERVEPASSSIKSHPRRSMRAQWATKRSSGPPSASAYARTPAESRPRRPGRGFTSLGDQHPGENAGDIYEPAYRRHLSVRLSGPAARGLGRGDRGPCQDEYRPEQVSHGAPTDGRIRGIADGQGLTGRVGGRMNRTRRHPAP